MGTWATGPFDNDSAADFASDVRGCTSPEARHELLLVTLLAGTVALKMARLDNEYSWDFELEHAVAAAAFVADEHTGRKVFTDTSYARGVGDDMELLPFVRITLSENLVGAARLFISQMVDRMHSSGIHKEWIDPVADIGIALAAT